MALFEAIRSLDFKLFKDLIKETNDNINEKDDDGTTCLHIAAGLDEIDFLNHLLQNGAAVDSATSDGLTPLHISAMWGKSAHVKTLIKFGANMFLKDNTGMDAYMFALSSNEDESEECVNLISQQLESVSDEENHELASSKDCQDLEMFLTTCCSPETKLTSVLDTTPCNEEIKFEKLEGSPWITPRRKQKRKNRNCSSEINKIETFELDKTEGSFSTGQIIADIENDADDETIANLVNVNKEVDIVDKTAEPNSFDKETLDELTLYKSLSAVYGEEEDHTQLAQENQEFIHNKKNDFSLIENINLSNLSDDNGMMQNISKKGTYELCFDDYLTEMSLDLLSNSGESVNSDSVIFDSPIFDSPRRFFIDLSEKKKDTKVVKVQNKIEKEINHSVQQNKCPRQQQQQQQQQQEWQEDISINTHNSPNGTITLEGPCVFNDKPLSSTFIINANNNSTCSKNIFIPFKNHAKSNPKPDPPTILYPTTETIIYDWKDISTTSDSSEEPVVSVPSSYQKLTSKEIKAKILKFGQTTGPITPHTKKLYLKKLFKLEQGLNSKKTKNHSPFSQYPPEVRMVLMGRCPIPDCCGVEVEMMKEFEQSSKKAQWRGGNEKSSFNYLLLDPRVSCNLPNRCKDLAKPEAFRCFVLSIFYVGKGKRSRPYAHLHEAIKSRTNGKVNKKLSQIWDVWGAGLGIISLHLFQSAIAVEAFTREACMLDALGLSQLTNQKRGEYYGLCSSLPLRKKRNLGLYFLYKAFQIFLHEGERQIKEEDL